MTSPPYWGLRDYGVSGQIGLEDSFEEFIDKLSAVCSQVMRVLKPSGSFYLNLGDTYAGSNMGLRDVRVHKSLQYPEANSQYPSFSVQSKVVGVHRKSLIGIPWRIALRLIDDGWILRNDIIWHKPNHMPSSVKDRLSSSYEHVFHFVKSPRYYYDLDAIRVPHKTASIKRMLLAAKEGLKPKTTKYTPDRVGDKGAQGGRYFVPKWAAEYYRQKVDWKARLAKTDRPLKPPHGVSIGGGHSGLSGANGKYGILPLNFPSHNAYKLGIYRDSNQIMNPLGKNPGDLWEITTRSFCGAHFAVYPEMLCVRPILSASPEKVCTKCGSPARKVSNGFAMKPFNIRYRDGKSGRLSKKWGDMVTAPTEETQVYSEQNYRVRSAERVVWPGCSCNVGFKPATILDPFAGSCTTLKVANDHGRNAIGIEINPDYIDVARQRLGLSKDSEALQVIYQNKPA